MSTLPYRQNVGAALFNTDGLVFVGRRADLPAASDALWQLPQGGMDEGEDPSAAVLRELEEEVGTAQAEILEQHTEWLSYDLPEALIGRAFSGRFSGQRQMWFALRFLGSDSDIVLDRDAHPEFSAWRWVKLHDIPALAVPFKRPIYERIARDFARWAHPA
jgi:putative (di)nucleoside polyphosphate hydrolase